MHAGGTKGRTLMIKSLSLSNFKSFGEKQILELAPLTLVFGKNSSGKSSIFQSLLFLKQSFQDIFDGYPPSFVGDDVDLLSIQHTLHNQIRDNSRNAIKLGILLSEAFDREFTARRGNQREVRPVRLPNIPLGMTFEWTWDDAASMITKSTWEVLIGEHALPPFSGILANRFLVPAEYDASSRYMHVSYEKYGSLLSQAHKNNINYWISLFTRGDAKKLHECISKITVAGKQIVLDNISSLRWISPERIYEHESTYVGGAIAFDEILAKKFAEWFNIVDTVTRRRETPVQVIEYDKNLNNSDEILKNELEEALGPQIQRHNVDQDHTSLNAVNQDISDTESDVRSDIISRLQQYYQEITDTYEWYVKEYIFIHFDNLAGHRNSITGKIIQDAGNYDALGLAVNPDVGDFLAITPVHWAMSASRSLQRVLGSLRHVTPVRDQLKRVYLDAAPSTAIGTVAASARPRYGRIRPTRSASGEPAAASVEALRASLRDPATRDLVNRALVQLEIPYEILIETNSVRAHEGVITEAIILKDINSNVKIGIPDVGYGVGQVIPLIISLMSLDDRLLVVEQPELHLHPGLQAHIGELLVEACQRFPNGQIIAETHSEHLILRVLKLIRTGKLSSDMISVLYVDQDNMNQAKVTKIGVDTRGEFTIRWPRGFFRERLLETIN